MSADLLRLAERVEGLTGPNYQIEREIAVALGMAPPVEGAPTYGWSRNWTSSLDAAMSLVPEGFAIDSMMIWPGDESTVTVLGTKLRPFGIEKKVSWVHNVKEDGRWKSKAATPALALTAACLRARAAAARGDCAGRA